MATIDLVATDHSPAPPALKHLDDGDFIAAWGGIASLQLVVAGDVDRRAGSAAFRSSGWPTGCAQRPRSWPDWRSAKAPLPSGHDADLVIVDPDREFTVDASRLYHRHAVTPYDGARLHGVVQKTMLRGEIVYENGACVGSPTGRLI